ncbi:MAG: FAD:protein FMN transferase [Raoultibacter sp.]
MPAVLSGCSDSPQQSEAAPFDENDESTPTSLVTFLYDTVIEIQAYCPQELLDKVEDRLVFFENIFSRTVSGSDIDMINHAAGEPVFVHPETIDVITQAIGYSELSGGLFDITIGSVVDLWDFKNETIPEPAALEQALKHVNYRTIELGDETVTLLDPAAKLDLGGIAKGYITDDIARLLREGGCESALINLGGNTYALGSRPNGNPWHVGLQDPNQPRGTVFGSVDVCDKSIIASGINERSFTKNGVSYHHLINPTTGMPLQNGVASTTIISDRSTDGDAFSTITFLMGLAKGLDVAKQYGGLDVLYIDTDGNTIASEEMRYESL